MTDDPRLALLRCAPSRRRAAALDCWLLQWVTVAERLQMAAVGVAGNLLAWDSLHRRGISLDLHLLCLDQLCSQVLVGCRLVQPCR